MKKFFGAILAIILALLCLTACTLGGTGDAGGNTDDIGSGNVDNSGSGNTDDENPTVTPPVTAVSDTLIVYFSCTAKTEEIAKHIEAETNGTLYQIMPETPYTADDLKYYTDCRADREQADPSARPAIDGSVADMEKYGVVFLGYPIWHGQAPRIISTFLESYDFSDKTIVPFCTSASSGIGSSDKNLHTLAPSANWVDGKRFASGTSREAVGEWIDSLNLKFTPEQEEITNMYLTINGNKIEVTLAENSAVDALVERLKQGDITYTANDYGGFEKVGGLGFSLPRSDTQITTEAGDVILYSGNQIVLFYGSNSYSYTRLGKINGYTATQLRTLLAAGEGSIQVTISLK
ncbi:MAG: hypothetical protein K2J30_05050 [Clostridia bacterium]|nr:hypothetical protein [Clostridia bacterium]